MTTLLMSSRHTEDDQALWRAAIGRGWSTARARGLNIPDIDDPEIVVYVEALYAPTIAGKGWAVVEANSAWGSGIYGCDPTAALDVIRHATIQPAGDS